MDLPNDQIEELKRYFGKVAATEEGGVPYVLLEGVQLPVSCSPSVADLLLCPVQQGGYQTRVYYSQRVASPTERNWNYNGRICDRQWFAYSWQVPGGTSQRLAQMVLAHLKALR